MYNEFLYLNYYNGLILISNLPLKFNCLWLYCHIFKCLSFILIIR